MDIEGVKLLNYLNKNLCNKSYVVKRRSGVNKDLDVKNYIDALERTHTLRHIDYLKSRYYDKYVIKEIPESYKEYLSKVYFETYGLKINDSVIEEHRKNIILDQEVSLGEWIDYFCSEDSSALPMWTKYWAFNGMLKIGNLEVEDEKYTKRTSSTVTPFIELDREALSIAVDLIIKKANNKIDEIADLDLKKLSHKGSFESIYTALLFNKLKTQNIECGAGGQWVKYGEGDNWKPLYDSLQGKFTGWCTAGADTCRKQIENGDFYVYYANDLDGNPIIPKIAIRMNGSYQIAEIRGTLKGQNLDPNYNDVLSEKLKEFPDKEKYEKRMVNVKKLTELYNDFENGKKLSLDDLLFIYQVNDVIKGYGQIEDPRIGMIIGSRNILKDIDYIFKTQEKITSLQRRTCLKITELDKIKIPEITNGITFDSLKSAKKIEFIPNEFSSISFCSLRDVQKLIMPEKVNGSVYLSSLETVDNVVLPKEIIGNLHLEGITDLSKLKLNIRVTGIIYFGSPENPTKLDMTNITCKGFDFKEIELSKYYAFEQKLNDYMPDSYVDFYTAKKTKKKIKPCYKKNRRKEVQE